MNSIILVVLSLFSFLGIQCQIVGSEAPIGKLRRNSSPSLEISSIQRRDLADGYKVVKRNVNSDCLLGPHCCKNDDCTDYYCGKCVKSMGCFPTSATVQTPYGEKSMTELKIGDLVMVASLSNGPLPKFSKMYTWLYHSFNQNVKYLSITTDSGHQLDISESHIMFANRFPMGTPAKNINVGDLIWVNQANNTMGMELSNVTSVGSKIVRGAHVPATMDGTVIVNGILASSYALDNHYIGHKEIHAIFAPLRWLHHASEQIWGSDNNAKFAIWQPQNSNVLWYAEGLKLVNKFLFK